MNKELTIRGITIGIIGSIFITISSLFVALKLSSLPNSILFVTFMSVLILKLFGNTNKNEINITKTAMTSSSAVAGGLAFTLPAIWILNKQADVSFLKILIVTLCGVVLGLVFSALVRKHFILERDLPYVFGVAAAKTLESTEKSSKDAIKLFSSMGVSAIFTALRDGLKLFPDFIINKTLSSYGSQTGIWISPMLMAVGYMIGIVPVITWFIGGFIGDILILVLGNHFEFWNQNTALIIKESVGIGLMVGTGIGILLKIVIPRIINRFAKFKRHEKVHDVSQQILKINVAGFILCGIFLVLTIFFNINFFISILLIVIVYFSILMASESVGQSGINPMEIFGIIGMLTIRTIYELDDNTSVYIVAIVTIACALCGNVMNDFKMGKVFHTNPRKQWLSEAIGALVGAFASVGGLYMILTAYGSDSFGSENFPSAQASMVATMISGNLNVIIFSISVLVALILYCCKVPVLTLGLGVYLPFYISCTVFLGGIIRFIVDNKLHKKETGDYIASGVLGGETLMGIIIATILAFGNIF